VVRGFHGAPGSCVALSAIEPTTGDGGAAVHNFVCKAQRAIGDAGFTSPGIDQASVLVFDSIRWTAHAAAAERLLDAVERERAARFRFDHDRSAYLLAHAMWRVALGVCLQREAAAVPLLSSPSGQPRLPGTSLATSLSHSGSWVAIAIGGSATLGVDIERSPARFALDDLLTMICTPPEAIEVRKLSAPAREQALLKLWTRKEALLKAFGTGLSEQAPAMLSARPGESVMPPPATGFPPCDVRDFCLPEGLVGALAMPVTTRHWRLHLLHHNDQETSEILRWLSP
jgi:4'-phosphopantetheinyl transferase